MTPERKKEMQVTVDSIRYLEPRPEERVGDFDWKGVASDMTELLAELDEAERREEVRRQFGEERGRLLDLASEVVEATRECASLTIGLKIPAALRVTEGRTYIASSNEYELLVELEEALKRYDKEREK